MPAGVKASKFIPKLRGKTKIIHALYRTEGRGLQKPCWR
jgi:hypothetical protein